MLTNEIKSSQLDQKRLRPFIESIAPNPEPWSETEEFWYCNQTHNAYSKSIYKTIICAQRAERSNKNTMRCTNCTNCTNCFDSSALQNCNSIEKSHGLENCKNLKNYAYVSNLDGNYQLDDKDCPMNVHIS